MTDDSSDRPGDTRRARIETDHGDRETARLLARTLRPDNTAEMDTRVEGSHLVTTIRRPTTGSLQATADDYVVNLQTGALVATGDSDPDRGSTAETGTARREAQRGNHNTDSTPDTSDSNNTETDNE